MATGGLHAQCCRARFGHGDLTEDEHEKKTCLAMAIAASPLASGAGRCEDNHAADGGPPAQGQPAARICQGPVQLRGVSHRGIHAVPAAHGAPSLWAAMVTRMKTVFKAPINDADMPEIVDYLVKTYGNEQPK